MSRCRRCLALVCLLLSISPAPALTLKQAVEAALAHSPALRAAEARAVEAEAGARLAGAGFHPEAYATTTPGYSSGLPVAVAGRVPAVAGLEVHQAIYSPSRRARALDAEASASVAHGGLERTRAALVRDVVLAYEASRLARLRVVSAEESLEAAQTISAHVAARRKEGRATELEAERQALEAARARQRLLDAESDRDLSDVELRRLADLPPASTIEVPDDPLTLLPSSASDTPARALASSPELKAVVAEIGYLRAAARVQGHRFAPEVDAAIQYDRLARFNNYDEFYASFKADDWSVGLSIAIPLFTGGRFESGRSRAEASLLCAESERRDLEGRLMVRALRAERDAERAESGGGLARREAGLLDEALRLARVLALEGRGEPEGVEQAVIARARGQERALEAEEFALKARLDLLDVRGELLAVLVRPGG